MFVVKLGAFAKEVLFVSTEWRVNLEFANFTTL